MDVSQELVKGTVIPVVLAALRDGPRYGYEIGKLVNARTNGVLEMKEGTLYPTLHRLEADGLVTAAWRPAGPDDGRQRKYYTLTRGGRRELDRRAAEWAAFTGAVNRMLAEA